MNAHPYILGSGDLELDRLATQHEVWRAATTSVWQCAAFGAGDRILDLGCGPGFTSFELAERVGPAGRVIAVDNSERFIATVQTCLEQRGAKNIDARLGDAYAPDLAPASVDGVFMRWLLCFLPDTARIINAAAAALAPGGRIAVMDYFDYLSIKSFPDSEIFTRIFSTIFKSFADAGGDLNVGGKLPGLMQDAGLEITHVRPIIEAARPGDAVWEWVRSFQKIYLPQLVEKGYLSAADLAENERDWQARAANPAGFFLSPPMLGVAARKPA